MGETPPKLALSDPFSQFLESMMKTYPDSIVKKLTREMELAKAKGIASIESSNKAETERHYVDVKGAKLALIIQTKLEGKAKIRSHRSVFNLNESELIQLHVLKNPLWIVQYMHSNKADLHYTGEAEIEGKPHYIVQVHIKERWVDVWIDKTNFLVSRIVIPFVDTNPLIGRGPEHFKQIYWFKDYRNVQGLYLPTVLEEIRTRNPYTKQLKLDWVSINKPFAPATFVREPSYDEKVRFSINPLRNGLHIINETGNDIRAFSLLRVTKDNKVDLFTNFSYHESINQKLRKAIAEHFPGTQMRNIFSIEHLFSISALSDLFDPETKMYVPKGFGLLSEEKIGAYNAREDSVWKARLATGEVIVSDTNFVKDDAEMLVLNPEFNENRDQLFVCYYLPIEKVIYLYGSARTDQAGKADPSPFELNLYKIIQARKLQVETIIYSNAWEDTTPYQLPFATWERTFQK